MKRAMAFLTAVVLVLSACSSGDRDALRKAGELPQRLEQEDSP